MSGGIQLSPSQLDAAAFLERCAYEREPLAALIGVAGSGKTVAANAALARLRSAGRRVVRISNFVAGPLTLHRTIAGFLGVARAAQLSADEIELELRNILAAEGTAEPPVIAVDDAQSLLPETLRYLRTLAGLRDAGRPRFCILLIGRPGFTAQQEIPLQFTLQAPQSDEATRIAPEGPGAPPSLDAAAAEAENRSHRLAAQRVARTEPDPWVPRPSGSESSAVTPAAALRPRRPSLARWLLLPAFLALGAGAAVVTFHYGLLDEIRTAIHHSSVPLATVPLATVPPAPLPAPLPAPPAAPPATGSASAPPAPAPQASAILPQIVPIPPPVQPPVPQAPRQESLAIAPPPPLPPKIAVPPAPRELPTEPVVARFRVYNSGPCHNGVCSHWAIANLDRTQRFVGAFDYSALKLDRDTDLRLRKGAIELTVSGFVTTNARGVRVVTATSLLGPPQRHGGGASNDAAVTPAVPPPPGNWGSLLATSPAANPAPPPPPPEGVTRSPPPGFLHLPGIGQSNPGDAASTPPPIAVPPAPIISGSQAGAFPPPQSAPPALQPAGRSAQPDHASQPLPADMPASDTSGNATQSSRALDAINRKTAMADQYCNHNQPNDAFGSVDDACKWYKDHTRTVPRVTVQEYFKDLAYRQRICERNISDCRDYWLAAGSNDWLRKTAPGIDVTDARILASKRALIAACVGDANPVDRRGHELKPVACSMAASWGKLDHLPPEVLATIEDHACKAGVPYECSFATDYGLTEDVRASQAVEDARRKREGSP